MSTIKEQISKKEHTDWVRCTLGLSKTTWALYDYVLNKFKNYTHGKGQLQPSQHFLTPAEEAHIRSSAGCIRICFDTKVKYQRKQSRWEWRDRCQLCRGAFEKIIALHTGVYNQTSHSEKDIYWSTNCTDTRGVDLEWAIAKMFMPKGNENNMTPHDTDPSAMLTILLNCNLFMNPIRKDPKYRLRVARNKLYHSRDNRVDETDKNDCFDDMCQILTDASNDMEVEEDIRKTIIKDIMEIKKLNEAEISMKMFDDALKEKRKGLFDDFEKCLSKFENDKDFDGIRRLLELLEKNAAYINELKEIEFYKKEIDDGLCVAVKDMSTSFQNMEGEIESKFSSIPEKLLELDHKVAQLNEDAEKVRAKLTEDSNAKQQLINNMRKNLECLSTDLDSLQDRLPHVPEKTSLFDLIVAMALFLALIAVSHM